MIESLENFKEKPKRRGRQLPVDFVIPLQLEECVYRLKTNPLPPDLRLQIKPTAEVEQFRFIAALIEEDEIKVEAEGTLQRWEGTSTRFQGQANFPAYDGFGIGCMANLLITFCACGLLPILLQTVLSRINTRYGDQLGLLMIIFLLAGSYFVISTFLSIRGDHNQRRERLNNAITDWLGM